MKNSILVTAVFISLSLFSGCASNKIAYRKPPKEDWRLQKPAAGPVADAALPQFETHRLSNGMQVILAKENRLPIVAVEVYVKAGSSSESYKQSGLASMLVNMLTKGTKRYNADEFSGALGRHRNQHFYRLRPRFGQPRLGRAGATHTAGLRINGRRIATRFFRPRRI